MNDKSSRSGKWKRRMSKREGLDWYGPDFGDPASDINFQSDPAPMMHRFLQPGPEDSLKNRFGEITTPPASGGGYVHDPESLYNHVGQEQFLRSMVAMQLNTLSFAALSQLVRQLLLLSGYSSVRSCGEGQNRKTWGEGGLELLGFSHTDISTTLTAIQIKHHRDAIPRRFVDELRGTMLRLRADNGLIVATAPFSALAVEAAGETGLPPVHLIDSGKLVAMTVERRLGLRAVRQEQSPGARDVFDPEFFVRLEAAANSKGKESPIKGPSKEGKDVPRSQMGLKSAP